ncbi:hypothetical protein [Acidisphaera sp. S103]|uniref:hypothetical protein n=1 Tax=Acidisphaera sp. S103 TaxID=1747223 RepID=UPI00131C87BC|nr:hypothetical protein [Acidisphaera sp. S103]
MARKLEASGMDRRAARGIVEVVIDALVEAKSAIMLATHSSTPQTGRLNDALPGINDARSRRNFTLQLGGLFVLWVWITLLGFSYLLHYR